LLMPTNLEVKSKTVLTLDLARHCGWAFVQETCPLHPIPLVKDCGVIDIGAHTIKRWINLESEIKNLFQRFSPKLILIEENFIFKNVRTTASLNQLRGAVLLLAALHNVKVDYIDNNSAKKALLGGTRYWDTSLGKYVGVTKEMMLTAVKNCLCGESIIPQNDDAADAVALALTYYNANINPAPLARKPKAVS
jgi:Holliday junction resolvasome RuvABC endonuclease subunit